MIRFAALSLFLSIACRAGMLLTCSVTDAAGHWLSTDCIDPQGRWTAQASSGMAFWLDPAHLSWGATADPEVRIHTTPDYTVHVQFSDSRFGSYSTLITGQPDGTPGVLHYVLNGTWDNESNSGYPRDLQTFGDVWPIIATPCTGQGISHDVFQNTRCSVPFVYGQPVTFNFALSVFGDVTSSSAYGYRWRHQDISGFLLDSVAIQVDAAPEPSTAALAGLVLAVIVAVAALRHSRPAPAAS